MIYIFTFLSLDNLNSISKIVKSDRIITIAVICLLSCLIFFLSDSGGNLLKLNCIHKTLLGVDCPLCGSTRATYELMHFHFGNTWNLNPAIFSVAVFFVFEIINIALKFKLEVYRRYLIWVIIISFAIVYIQRIIEAIIV